MKKFSMIALAILGMASAHASIYDRSYASPWYWQADLGYSELDFDFGESNRTEDGIGVRVSLGKDKGDYRYAYDYSYFGNAQNDYYWRSGTNFIHDEYTLYAHSLGVSAFYDFDNNSRITPYVGARVGINFLSDELRRCVSSAYVGEVCGYSKANNTDTRVGIGGVVGASYQATPTTAINVSGEYNYLGKVGDVKVSQTGANIGVRMNF